MDNTLKEYVLESFKNSIKTKQAILENENILLSIHKIADKITEAMKNGNKLLIAGNGGSAADAQHVAGEFVNRFHFDRPGLPCIALTTDTSVLTALATITLLPRYSKNKLRLSGKPAMFL